MSDTFRSALGRSVVGRDDAEAVGDVSRFLVDGSSRKVVGFVTGSGRKATAYGWGQITGFGPDAVLVQGPQADPALVEDAGSGRNDPLDKRLLTTLGEEVGKVADVEFDPDSGEVLRLLPDGGQPIDAEHLRGVGSYAVVVDLS